MTGPGMCNRYRGYEPEVSACGPNSKSNMIIWERLGVIPGDVTAILAALVSGALENCHSSYD